MSKLLPTLFLVIIVAIIAGTVFLSFTDVPVSQSVVSGTITLEQFKANSQS